MKELILVRGLPGSGKSTMADLLRSGKRDLVISTDMFFEDEAGSYNFDPNLLTEAHDWTQDRVREHMDLTREYDDGIRIIVANTFTRLWEMGPYLDLAEEFGWRTHTLIVENRHGSASIHGVPEVTIKKMRDRFNINL